MSAHMMERMMDSEWMPMMGFGMLFMALFWMALIVGGVLMVMWGMRQGGVSRGDSALEILKQRYARGEIDQQEFEEKKRDLLA